MIPRILVPKGARLPDGDLATTTRRRPSSLDERTLVPSELPVVPLDGHSTIPSNLPLESIAARVVVPRDVNVAAVQKPEESHLPVQPTDMDERITIPQGVKPPEEFQPLGPISADLVEPDILQTGEVAFLSPESRGERSLGEKINATVSVAMHVAVIALIIFAPKVFAPHIRTNEEEDLARRQMTVLLPPGALDSLKPSPATPPAPHELVKVDPRVIRKVAPTPIEKPAPAPPVPTPEPPKRELPSAPAPQPNATPPPPTTQPTPSKGDLPKTPLKLDQPEMPVPQNGLILPKNSSPGDAIKDAARQSMGKMSAPQPIGGGRGQPIPGGQGGGGGRGSAGMGPVQILTDTQGVDFNDYLRRVYVKVKQNWFSVMPPSVQLGERGDLSLRFRIMADGSVPDGEPVQVYSSGKEPLDRAAFSSIRASNPFPPLPSQFHGPFIELQFSYYYNEIPPGQ